tara:strand:+ start:5 stop:592 length:588 start_codon:yes stop_codon:yes gene_type:complete
MNVKSIIQIFILIFIISISFFTFKKYFSNDTKKIVSKVGLTKKSDSNEGIKTGSFIKNMKYVSNDQNGNRYEIFSKTAETNNDNPDLISMNGVKAIISLGDNEDITIISDYAVYNSINYETNFKQNVQLNYLINDLLSDNLDLSFDKNLATLHGNVIYNNLNTNMNADIIELDLLTKDTKIFMKQNSNKVKITTK